MYIMYHSYDKSINKTYKYSSVHKSLSCDAIRALKFILKKKKKKKKKIIIVHIFVLVALLAQFVYCNLRSQS